MNKKLSNDNLRLVIVFLLLVMLAFAIVFNAEAHTIKVAVIDTGFDFKSTWPDAMVSKPKMCRGKHKDFTGKGIQDKIGHGTSVTGLISKYAQDVDYCIIVIKFFDINSNNSISASIKSIEYAISQKVKVINISMGGYEKSKEECRAIKKALDKGIAVVAAIGNGDDVNHIGLDVEDKPFYPALCDRRVLIVENIDEYGNLATSSNYSSDDSSNRKPIVQEVGVNVLSLAPHNKLTKTTGSSQSTAIVTGKLVNSLGKGIRK